MTVVGEVIGLDDRGYPARIKSVFAGEIWASGNKQLLDTTAIGICGSRDASEDALKWAEYFGRKAAEFRITVVSGYARGVDRRAHKGALEAGGSTIAVLPQGISHFSVVSELKGLVEPERNFLAISMFQPDDSWQVWRAMERNKLIVALSAGLFVIEARESGGTINAAYECLRQGKKLWAIAYEKNPAPRQAGNRKLIAEAAVPLRKSSDLEKALQEAMKEPPAEVRQLVLNLVGSE